MNAGSVSFFLLRLLLLFLSSFCLTYRGRADALHAVVIGGGPAGLAAALGLSKRGFTVDVLEKRAAFSPGATLGLQPNGIKALREIVGHEDSRRQEQVTSLLALGIPLPNGGSMLAWFSLHDWLVERAKECDGITLRTGVCVLSIDDRSDPSCVVVKCEGEEVDLRGDILVGADGINSQVRSFLDLPPKKISGSVAWRGSVVADTPALKALLSRGVSPVPIGPYGTTLFAVFNHHPALHGRLNWAVSTREPDVQIGSTTPWDLVEPHLRREEDAELRGIFREILDKSAELGTAEGIELGTVELPRYEKGEIARGWGGRGRVTMIGDAAHAVNSVGGQGTSLAFEDAAILCRKLEASRENNNVPSSTSEWEEFILDFENERYPRVKRIADEQERMMRASYRGDTNDVAPTEEFNRWLFEGV